MPWILGKAPPLGGDMTSREEVASAASAEVGVEVNGLGKAGCVRGRV